MICVLCQGHTVGRVGRQRYFCFNCSVEFTVNTNTKESAIFSIDKEGVVVQEGVGHIEETKFVWSD